MESKGKNFLTGKHLHHVVVPCVFPFLVQFVVKTSGKCPKFTFWQEWSISPLLSRLLVRTFLPAVAENPYVVMLGSPRENCCCWTLFFLFELCMCCGVDLEMKRKPLNGLRRQGEGQCSVNNGNTHLPENNEAFWSLPGMAGWITSCLRTDNRKWEERCWC